MDLSDDSYSYISFGSKKDAENNNLKWLIDAFFPVRTPEEIASAYCKSKGDVEMAVEILSGMQISGAVSHDSVGGSSGTMSELLPPVSNTDTKKLTPAPKNSRGSKPKKKISVSMGMVSGFMGKGCARPVTIQKESCKVNNNLKLKEDKWATPKLVQEDFAYSSRLVNESVNNSGIEDFLFSMLGVGFQLDMDTIRDVLNQCGYDAKKSMKTLLGLSNTNLGKDMDGICDTGTSTDLADKGPTSEALLEENFPKMDYAERCRDDVRPVCSSGMESSSLESERYNMQKEVLQSLFKVPERPDQAPKKIVPTKQVVSRKVVRQMAEAEEPSAVIEEAQQDNEGIKKDVFEALRRDATRHWDAMKAYYEAAVDAFTKGNHDEASYLLKEGNFYKEKAREAEDKSAKMIFETENMDVQNIVTLDVHDHVTKEAISLLKFHLTSLACIPSIEFLKVIMEANTQGVTKGIRKNSVFKLLEKESIKWSEEGGNPGTILIQMNEINPKKLSFAKPSSSDDDD